MIKYFLIPLTFLFIFNTFSQEKSINKDSLTQLTYNIDSLRNCFTNKLIPNQIEKETLFALSRYDEFKNTSIVVKTKRINATFYTRPKGLNVLKPKGKRKYIILWNNYENVVFSLNSFSFNARIGVLAHELAHIKYYEQKSSISLVFMGIKYLINKKFKRKIEKNTDLTVINKGLGFQLYSFNKEALSLPFVDESKKEYKKEYYMTPQEILTVINRQGKELFYFNP